MMEMYLGPLMVLRQIPERPTSTDRSPTIIWRSTRTPGDSITESANVIPLHPLNKQGRDKKASRVQRAREARSWDEVPFLVYLNPAARRVVLFGLAIWYRSLRFAFPARITIKQTSLCRAVLPELFRP